MYIRTSTSLYELECTERGFWKLTKLKIFQGESSKVQPGESFKGLRFEVEDTLRLYRGGKDLPVEEDNLIVETSFIEDIS